MAEPSDLPKVNYMDSLDLGELTKLVSIFAAFAYAIGVVAVNTYLHELGIVDFRVDPDTISILTQTLRDNSASPPT
jgi:hypothetical protein